MAMPRCVHEMVAEQAARTPDRIAISYVGATLTYRQLDRAADALSVRLREVGVGGGAVVAVVMGRTPELIVTLTAILKSGGAYLYLDPAEPQAQRARIVRDAQARFAVVGVDFLDHAPEVAQVLPLERDMIALAGSATDPLGGLTHPDTPAYVCYTSGSTGEPKGVVVSHTAIWRLIDQPTWIDVRDDDVFLQLTRVGFDVSTFEIWMPLVRGCRLALAPTGHADLEEIVAVVKAEEVTVLWLTTGLFHKIVTHHLDGLAGVRHLLAGGDVLSPTHVQRVMSHYPGLIFTNGYGPTENTTFSTCWTTSQISSASRVPIGIPIDGSTAAVLDDRLRPVAPGEIGELWVGGHGVAIGYLNRPGATAEKFVADCDPSAPPGSRMYRTGDLARWEEDGTLDFLGRADRQVKIRGYRVELSTVEVELSSYEEVEQAAALTYTDGAGDTKLLAYVAVGQQVDPEEHGAFGVTLRERLQAVFPAHLVPWAVIVLQDIPLNPNGKVDRSALPTKIPRNVWNDYVEPRDPTEQLLAEIWSDALDVEPIGVEDNFFELGGHSLLAAELLAVLHHTFDVKLPARTLFLRPTIADLAEELRRQGVDKEATNAGTR
ncbi:MULTISPECIES: non-ribosomal peptide synthetase [Streptosporangium]|uniref:non-ribosomal peptide synthetase n=1 Tax=Streptosporangium TaxID=2000 RepID=UPI000A6152AA|nr:non-ribosomal peptide synthetase [Streptosporangium amethystogenes]